LAGEHELSLKIFQRHATLKDSLFTKANTTLITNMETKRMVELKEKDIEIARLEVEKKRNERWFLSPASSCCWASWAACSGASGNNGKRT